MVSGRRLGKGSDSDTSEEHWLPTGCGRALEHRGANVFFTLLIATFLTGLAASFGVVRLFDRFVVEGLARRYWLVRRG